METRIIRTSLHRDPRFRSESVEIRLLILFLLSNEYLEALPCVELDDGLIEFYLGVPGIASHIKDLQYYGIYRVDSFILLSDKFAYANYQGGKTSSKKTRLYETLPETIKNFIDLEKGLKEDSLPTAGRERKGRSTRKEISATDGVETEKVSKVEQNLSEVVSVYNRVFNKNIKSTRGFEDNFKYWFKEYTLDDIYQAINKAKEDPYWSDKMTLTILFRQKNSNGEAVDYIQDLKERSERESKIFMVS